MDASMWVARRPYSAINQDDSDCQQFSERQHDWFKKDRAMFELSPNNC